MRLLSLCSQTQKGNGGVLLKIQDTPRENEYAPLQECQSLFFVLVFCASVFTAWDAKFGLKVAKAEVFGNGTLT